MFYFVCHLEKVKYHFILK